MTSAAQIAANRRNAGKSTGPRTPEGKAASAQNALKHGLTAERASLRGEDRAAHERLRADLFARHRPEGEAEARLVDDLAFHYLRLSRLPRAEAAAWEGGWEADPEGAGETDFAAALRRGALADLVKLSLYEQRIRRAIEQARAELARAQAERRAAERAMYGAPTEADGRAEAEALLAGLAEIDRRRAAEPPRPLAPPAASPRVAPLPLSAVPIYDVSRPGAPGRLRDGDEWLRAPKSEAAPAG